jgi:cytoskeletal protein RodZ
MATITISNTGGNWNATPSWVGGVVPGASDDVVATATSGNLTVTANTSILTVNFTNYVSTFTVNSGITLTINGNLTLSTGMTTSGTGILSFNPAATAPTPNTATLTSNGIIWTGSLTFATGTGKTILFGDAWTIGGNLNFSPASSGVSTTFNNNSVSVRGDIVVSISNRVFTASGSTVFISAPLINTTSTISTPNTSANAALRNPLTLNGAGTIFFSPAAAGGHYLELGTSLFWTAGTVTMDKTTELRFVVATTFTLSGMNPIDGVIRFNGSVTNTLTNNMPISGTLIFGTVFNTLTIVMNGASIILTGNLTAQSQAGGLILSGTTIIVISGNSIINLSPGFTPGSSGRLGISTTIDSTGFVTFSTSVTFGGAGQTFSYNNGTVSISNALNWNSTAAARYNMNKSGFSFPNFTASVAPTFGGSFGCSFYTYGSSTAGITHTFGAGNSYSITNGIDLRGTNASRISFVSTVTNTQAILTVLQGATIDVGYVNATDIDASLGQTIWSYRGTLTRTNNWQQLPTQPKTVSHFKL